MTILPILNVVVLLYFCFFAIKMWKKNVIISSLIICVLFARMAGVVLFLWIVKVNVNININLIRWRFYLDDATYLSLGILLLYLNLIKSPKKIGHVQ